MRGKSLCSLLLALTLALSLALPAAAAEGTEWLIPRTKEAPAFSDTSGVWCEDEVVTVCEAGLMEGRSAERFDIASPLTNAQIAVISARLQSLLAGGDGVLEAAAEDEAWYASALRALSSSADEEVQYVLRQFAQSPETYPGAACTRRTFALMVAGILTEPLPAISAVARVPDSTDPQVLMLYNAGVLTGNDRYGTFDGDGSLTRGQAAAILARLADPSLRRTVTLEPFDLCADVLGLTGDTVLLTVGGEAVTADQFACQLCTSLCQWEGNDAKAVSDAIRVWCFYDAPFQALAAEKGVALTAEEQAQAEEYARETAGYLGLAAGYWRYQYTGTLLSSKLKDLYWAADWKGGEAAYHKDLEAVSETLLAEAVPSEALTALDLTAVYQRLLDSPFPLWNF